MGKTARNDLDKIKDALQKIKSENRKLRKENSALKKQLSRAEIAAFEHDEDSDDSDVLEITDDGVADCPKCKVHSVLHEIKAGRYTIQHCKTCGYKKRIDSLKKT